MRIITGDKSRTYTRMQERSWQRPWLNVHDAQLLIFLETRFQFRSPRFDVELELFGTEDSIYLEQNVRRDIQSV